MQTRSKSGISKKKSFATSTTIDYLQTEPPTYTIASKFPQWREAMASEFAALQRQHTWQLVPPSSDQNVVGCRWVYKIKRNSDGSVSRYKARLVAKGFHQQAGVDFAETFSPVVKPPTVRIILSLAAQNQWSLRQLDVSNAFLHGLLKETVFMAQPLGFVEFFTSFSRLSPTQVSVWTQTGSPCLDLGPLRYFLGLQIDYKKGGFFVHQRKYLTDLLHKFTLTDCKAASTPIATTPLLTSTSTELLSDPTPYRSLVGALQYATFTRPDITFAVNRALLTEASYFNLVPFALTAFTDADWAGDPCDRRSTSGIIVFLGNNPITWLAKKQHTVSRSSTEAEYRSLASGAAELSWIRQLQIQSFHGRTKHIEVDYHFIRERGRCVVILSSNSSLLRTSLPMSSLKLSLLLGFIAYVPNC
uniref:Reverse transcriptase Ty1/copia-type domain-containing protein n=1 Tax=Fagus sylvatica TaxID=28930 RepID=A0A2N9J1J5_FAGSY